MNRILLINFGRMGDILQTSPLITCLREKYPAIRIGYLAASNFEDVMQGIPGIDEIHAIDLTQYMLPLRDEEIINNVGRFNSLIDELSGLNYDTIINLTHNRLGAILSWLLPGETIGMTLDKEGIASVENPWMRQFYNTNINRGMNQFNLVDLYKLSAGYGNAEQTDENCRLRFNVEQKQRENALILLRENGWKVGRKLIGIQVGASTTAKQWAPTFFNEACKSLSEDFDLVFLGTLQESEIIEESSREIKNALILAGKTGMGELAAVLEKCTVLVSNDTGTMHLAAAVGTPVVAVTLGPALASETGPYGRGHIIIEPDIECFPCSYARQCLDFACHSKIKPELINVIVQEVAADRSLDKLPHDLLKGVKISVTGFDENGLWKMIPLSNNADSILHQVNIAYRSTWLHLLNCNNIKEINIDNDTGKDVALNIFEGMGEIHVLIDLATKGLEISTELSLLGDDPQRSLAQIKELGNKLSEIDGEISSVGDRNIHLRPLTLDFNLGKEALPAADLHVLTKLTGELYQRLEMGSRLFLRYISEPNKTDNIPTPAIMNSRKTEKILAVNTPYFATGEIIRAFERRGLDFRIVDLNREVRDQAGGAEEFIDKFLKSVEQYKPDFVFTVNHLGFDSDGYVLEKLEHLGIKSAVYYVDSPVLIMDQPEKLTSELSTIFCWDRYYVERLMKAGFPNVHYLPLAADTNYFYPRKKEFLPDRFRSRMVFVADSLISTVDKYMSAIGGELASDRIQFRIEELRNQNGRLFPEIIEAAADDFNFVDPEMKRLFMAGWMLKIYQSERMKILDAVEDYGLTIFGDEYWETAFNGSRPDLHERVNYLEELPLVYNGTDIGLNMTSYQMPKGVNQRVFDIPACGGFLLTDYREALEEIFDINTDISVYNSAEEARELTRFYLSRPDLRKKMSTIAKYKILQNHTYDHRAAQILEIMEETQTAGISSTDIIQDEKSERGLSQSIGNQLVNSGIRSLPPELEAIKHEFSESLDVPAEISIHRISGKSLIIAPERAAWIVTDEIGEHLISKLSNGQQMGEAAAAAAVEFSLDGESALRKLRKVIESMNSAGFRDSFDLDLDDIDKEPRNLQLFLTKQCNLHCSHCYFSAGKSMADEMTTEQWKAAIRKFAFMGQGNAVTFTGGEPLLHPDIYELAGEAVENGLQTILLTNGQLIKDQPTARKISDLFDSIQISVDGVSSDVNDAIRGKGTFDRAVNAVKMLLAAKAEVEMTCVVLPENVEDLEINLKSFVESFGSGRLKYALAVANPIGRLKEGYRDETVSLAGRVIDACGDVSWLRVGSFNSGCLNIGCPLARSVVINPEGNIGSCPYQNYSGPQTVHNGDFTLSVRQDREWHRDAMMNSDKCKTCDLRNFQCGGCRIFGDCTDQIKLRSYYRMLNDK